MWLTATPFPPFNFLFANLTRSDQSIHARLRQSLACAIHAEAQCISFDSILAAMRLVIIGARLLHRFAIGMLGKRRSAPSGYA
jgi:hypothetical protein